MFKEAFVKFAEYRPVKGQPVVYKGKLVGSVMSVEKNLCWCDYSQTQTHGEPGPFIWAFQDGVNAFHDWPTKDGAPIARHGGPETVGHIAPKRDGLFWLYGDAAHA